MAPALRKTINAALTRAPSLRASQQFNYHLISCANDDAAAARGGEFRFLIIRRPRVNSILTPPFINVNNALCDAGERNVYKALADGD
jgi:hypothetical protein